MRVQFMYLIRLVVYQGENCSQATGSNCGIGREGEDKEETCLIILPHPHSLVPSVNTNWFFDKSGVKMLKGRLNYAGHTKINGHQFVW
jgi:hypothetical protein